MGLLSKSIGISLAILLGAAPLAGSQIYNFTPGQLIIKMRHGQSQLNSLLASSGFVLKKTFRGGAVLIESGGYVSRPEILKIASDFANRPEVLYAEPNYYIKLSERTPDDAEFGKLFGLHNTGGSGGTIDADIDAPEAWETTTGSRTVKVAVIDSGVDASHPDLAANIWQNPGEIGLDDEGNDKRSNGKDDDGNGRVDDFQGWDFASDDNDPSDDHSHGSHCAGIIGAVGNNALGVAGVNWQVSLIPIKSFDASGTATADVLVESIEYAGSLGVDVINASWGGSAFPQIMHDAIAALRADGILFVAAAGNSGQDADRNPHYPSGFNLDNIIAVGASDHNDELAQFSNYGRHAVDVAAPGVDIYSTVPGGKYASKKGTSMAAPHVAGLAALIRSVFPDASMTEVRDRIILSADTKITLMGKVATGRVNAARAIEHDTVPPGIPANPEIVSSGINNVFAQWEKAGDDGDLGEAAFYEVRISNEPIISEAEWTAATKAALDYEVTLNQGTVKAIIQNLELNKNGYLAVRAVDNVGNWGGISDSVPFSVKQVEIVYKNDATSMDGIEAESPWGLEDAGNKTVFSDSPEGDYSNKADTSMILPPLAMTSREFLIAITSEYHFEEKFDFGYVEVSLDNKATWLMLTELNGQSDLNTLHLPFKSEKNNPTEVYLRLRVVTDKSITFDGWKVHGIAVLAPVVPE